MFWVWKTEEFFDIEQLKDVVILNNWCMLWVGTTERCTLLEQLNDVMSFKDWMMWVWKSEGCCEF